MPALCKFKYFSPRGVSETMLVTGANHKVGSLPMSSCIFKLLPEGRLLSFAWCRLSPVITTFSVPIYGKCFYLCMPCITQFIGTIRGAYACTLGRIGTAFKTFTIHENVISRIWHVSNSQVLENIANLGVHRAIYMLPANF